MKFNSIRFKISILYIAILGIILIIHSGSLYLSLHYILYDDLDSELMRKVETINKAINFYVEISGYDRLSFLLAAKKVIKFEGLYQDNTGKVNEFESQWLQKVDKYDLQLDYINLLNLEGQPIVCSKNLTKELGNIFKKDIKMSMYGKTTFKNITFNKNKLRVISAPFSYQGHDDQYLLQVGTSLKPIINILRSRLIFTSITIPIILLLASFIGRIFAVRILKPVVEVTRIAKNITHENLSVRVKAEHIDEEMRYLVEAFNEMISRLEGAFHYIAEFSSEVAHELKTPLAIIRGESELALRKERDAEEYKRVITINLQETQRMLKSIDDLLLLTKLEYRPEVFKFIQFDLVNFFSEIYEQTKILASQKDITVTLDIPEEQIIITGDKLHLRRLFFNLIDNAIKFTSNNGRIDIAIISQEKTLRISISDTGIGIEEEDLPKIFNRFFHLYRGDWKSEAGIGLGLSIAQSIVETHHGKIEVKSRPGQGSTFTVILPFQKS